VRAAAPSGFAGPWPRLSIWQGQADSTVAPENSKLLATQWRALHGLTEPAVTEQVGDGVLRQVWPDARQPVVELWSLSRLAHAYPAGTRNVAPGRFVAPTPIDATASIAGFFGLD
jgi:poly(3-hydroxybutyrate) depolymerase